MKILSYNVRGLGSTAKRKTIRDLVSKEQVDMLCIQETKLQLVDQRICAQVWGDSELEWQAIPAENRGGGILCVWKRGIFNMTDCIIKPGFIGLIGTWGDMTEASVIANVYSSCRLEDKRTMWRDLLEWKEHCPVTIWCLCGDFNSVRSEEERSGVSMNSGPQRREMAEFNRFIEEMGVLDIPLSGRKFTWYRPNGQAKS